MLGLLLRFYRISALLIWFPFTAILALPYQFSGWSGVRGVSAITRLWGWGIAKIINLRIHLKGDISQFNGGLLVSNHQSYLDIICHSAVFKIRFAPKVEIRSWPILGWILGLSRPVWVNRNSRQKSFETLIKFRDTMKHGMALIVYPEGTTSSGKEGLLPFKSTPFEAAVDEKDSCKVLPFLTIYKKPAKGENLAWYGDQTLAPHAWRVLAYPRMDVYIYPMAPVNIGSMDRKEAAKFIHDMMEKEYYKILNEIREEIE